MAKKKTRKPARRFVVGWPDAAGRNRLSLLGVFANCDIMTMRLARLQQKELYGATIYELVPVELKAKGGGV